MNTRISTALALIAGLVGGGVSGRLFAPTTVRAQAPAQSQTQIRAQEFILVDQTGVPRGVFGFHANGDADLQISNGDGKVSFWSNDVQAVRWNGVARQKSVLPGLARGPQQPVPAPNGSE